ncbi:lipoprotein [Azorhizobium oxalatiphilum]|uniref:Lipoprotein n=1 Tax=Azorhizobium oxalatiphilum TaxID=980631 RepID=A0A917FI62_9HYPH|nr:tripartite tricarboxylate transporter substrate binding protein [Azorhizobium oxalatiphilum]GGF86605.1 lipoprotein [Azorhizobium oxalatiphilum]
MKVRTPLAAMLGLVLCVAATPSFAYPDKPITVVVPFPPGGATDTTARVMGEQMAHTLGKPVVIDNRPGATGAIGAAQVKNAAPDGYTMMVASIGTYAVNPFLQKDLRYDPQKDFDLITVAVRTPNVLVATPAFPANSVAELVALMKKSPGKVTFASSGSGSSDHLTAALFWQKTGTEGSHIPYKGGAPAISDLIGGHVEVSFQNLGAVVNQIKAGKLKALAVTSDKRVPQLPDVPTLEEAGAKDVVVYSWQAAAAPKGLPADVRAKLSGAAIDALRAPEVAAKFNDLGFEIVANDSKAFDAFLAAELARWKAVIEAGNITAN